MRLRFRREGAVTFARRFRVTWHFGAAAGAGAVLFLAAAASAATLDISGPYGNEAGCRFAASGDYGDDSLLLLTAEEVSSFATGCKFTAVRPAGNGVFAVDVLCSHEGEEEKTTGAMRLEKVKGDDAWTIFDEDGSRWGTVGRC